MQLDFQDILIKCKVEPHHYLNEKIVEDVGKFINLDMHLARWTTRDPVLFFLE